MTKKKIDEVFFQLFCEKNSDGTKHLRLKGKELFQRFGRRLNKNDMFELAVFLKKYPEVRSLDLAYNDLEDEGIRILAENYFNEENQMEYLNLLHCDIHADGIRYFSSAQCLKLKNIRLTGNKLGAEGARFIGRLIENCPTLEGLDIGETDQTLESIESLLIVIEKSPLKSVNISRIIPNSYYSRYNNSNLADDLGTLLKLNTSLEVLRVQKCEFDGHNVELLLGGLQIHKNLTMLDLAANRIGDHGVFFLAKWLRTRPNLIALRLPSNAISNRGGQALALNLPFSKIRLLDIHCNNIGDQGISDILDSLKKSTQIRMLFFWGNTLGKRALSKLERTLKSGILQQEQIDVKLYYVGDKKMAAYYPSNHFNHKSYSVMDYGFPPELKIVKNKIPDPDAQPRTLMDFEFIGRFPAVDESLGLKVHKTFSDTQLYDLGPNDKCN